MLTKKQAEISSEALLLSERERFAERVANHAAHEERKAIRQRRRRVGALLGSIVGCVLYFTLERSLFLVLASSVVVIWLFDSMFPLWVKWRALRTPDRPSSQ